MGRHGRLASFTPDGLKTSIPFNNSNDDDSNSDVAAGNVGIGDNCWLLGGTGSTAMGNLGRSDGASSEPNRSMSSCTLLAVPLTGSTSGDAISINLMPLLGNSGGSPCPTMHLYAKVKQLPEQQSTCL